MKRFGLVLALAFVLVIGCVTPALADSQPVQRFKAYLKELYYARQVKQVSRFWIKNARVPMDELLGTAESTKLVEMKKAYIYNPIVETELLDGNVATITGRAIAQSNGIQCKAKFNVVMRFEEGNWRIQYYTWQGSIPGHY